MIQQCCIKYEVQYSRHNNIVEMLSNPTGVPPNRGNMNRLNLLLDLAILLLVTALVWIVIILFFSYFIGSNNGAGSDIETFFYGILLLPSVMVISFNTFLLFYRSWKKYKPVVFTIDLILILVMLITMKWPIAAVEYLITNL